MRHPRFLASAAVSALVLASGDLAAAAPKIDPSVECVLGVLGEPGTTDECLLSVVTDANKGQLEKKPHDRSRPCGSSRAGITDCKDLSSLAALSKLENLETIEMAGTAVKDFSPLKASAKKLRRVRLPDDTPMSAVAFLAKENPKIELAGVKK